MPRGLHRLRQALRRGLLQSANEGLLFLDEIGELGLDEQAMLLRAIEEKRFLPVGSDNEVASDFQLIAGTNRDLAGLRPRADVPRRSPRPDQPLDLLPPGPAGPPRGHRTEPRLRVGALASATGRKVTINKEALPPVPRLRRVPGGPLVRQFPRPQRLRDPHGDARRAGRITVREVDEEIGRLQAAWGGPDDDANAGCLEEVLPAEEIETLDLFDRAQLGMVVDVCRQCSSLSEAGRTLFAVSRKQKAMPNDADRLRKYLARFGLSWGTVTRLRETWPSRSREMSLQSALSNESGVPPPKRSGCGWGLDTPSASSSRGSEMATLRTPPRRSPAWIGPTRLHRTSRSPRRG